MLDLNVTFLIQMLNLVVTIFLINYLLVRPICAIMAKRKAGNADMTRQIDSFVSRAALDAEHYEKTLRTANEEGGAMRRQAREDALVRQQSVLAASSAEALDLVRRERERAHADSERAEVVLRSQVDQLAADVMRKLLA